MENAKQKAIEVAYGIYWEELKYFVEENGWYNWFESKNNTNIDDLDFETSIDGFNLRPKLLAGIETNNNWISIHSEDDLPNTDGKSVEFWFMTNHGDVTINGYNDSSEKALIYSKIYTHYQPIIKPKKPIY